MRHCWFDSFLCYEKPFLLDFLPQTCHRGGVLHVEYLQEQAPAASATTGCLKVVPLTLGLLSRDWKRKNSETEAQ